MRRTTVAWVLGAALALVAGRAAATETKGETGGKGGLGPKASVDNDNAPDTALPVYRTVDSTNKKAEQERPWEIGASFETHRMFVQSDGAGVNKVFNAFGVYGQYRITDNDTLGIQEFFTENFIADPGETGVRAGDVAATYTRSVTLPRDFLFSATVGLSAPTSFISQKQGLITSPRFGVGLNKKVGRYINLGAHLGGGVFITRYAEAEGGQANPLGNVTGTLTAEVIMPFHEPLSFGISVSDGYVWFQNVQSGDPSVVSNGVVADAAYPNQPVAQQYGGEIYGRYTLPTLAGLKSDLTVEVADGDPNLSYNSYLHSGIGYTYLYNRLSAEMFASFSVRY